MKSRWRAIVFAGLFIAPCLTLPALANLTEDRASYKQALKHLRAGQTEQFIKTRQNLQNYPLYPYLEYESLLKDAGALSALTVNQFRQNWSDSPLAERLYGKWLGQLAKSGQWQTYLDNYEPGKSTTRHCNFLRALQKTGEQALSMASVEQLWLKAKSQPKACDPLFSTWIANKQLTNELAWQRLKLVLAENNRKLASYLLRYFQGNMQRTSNTFVEVHRKPALLTNHNRFSPDSVYVRDIIAHGLVRLARTQPNKAIQAWDKYSHSHSFTYLEKQSILQDIQIYMAQKNILPAADTVAITTDAKHEIVIEAIAWATVRSQKWLDAIYWIQRLPNQVQAKVKWRYWLSRSILNEQTSTQTNQDLARAHLEFVSNTRTYYGFLAAHALGLEPKLNNQSSHIDSLLESRVANMPGIQRARELYATKRIISATREWLMTTNQLSKIELAAAAKIAADFGWLNQSIRTANLAELRDDLQLRFPTPYREIFAREANSTQVPENLLYGIGRQESAFAPSVVSSAGALGIMQLMPYTAAETARKAGVRAPARSQLLSPEMNIKLGSRYMSGLLQRYNGNRAVAAAAYNAGPSRADRWLKRNPSDPIDLWIESIPFKETRNYVKNVLAFTYIFSQHLEQKIPFLSEDEARGLPSYHIGVINQQVPQADSALPQLP